jgi:mono/diheme cytochrome c family protein
MNVRRLSGLIISGLGAAVVVMVAMPVHAQLVDKTKFPNAANDGIAKSLEQQIGAGRGDEFTPDSSLFIIARDPYRAIRRGRQLFQRKFSRAEGQGPGAGENGGLDGSTNRIDADNERNVAIGAGLADSCATCHGRPRGAAGFGGDVVTRPDSRDAPHLFGLGLKEMLADEITNDLRAIRTQALAEARLGGNAVTMTLQSKGIQYGAITAHPSGAVDTSRVEGVNSDLRVRPFFLHGKTISIREFIVGAAHAEMGLNATNDLDLGAASRGGRVITPAGMVLDGAQDVIEAPPRRVPRSAGRELATALVDYLEFYLLNYFKPATYEQTAYTDHGRQIFLQIGCGRCHIPDFNLDRDRRVADVETKHDPVKGIFNTLFATATALVRTVDDHSGHPPKKVPQHEAFLVKDIFTDFKRHDLGPRFHERLFDGTIRTEFLTTPLWGVGSTPPYGHDGRSINLTEVILRHGGEAQGERDAFAALPDQERGLILDFLNALVLFPPDDTASNLDPGNRAAAGFPQFGHGSIKLGALFNNPADPE